VWFLDHDYLENMYGMFKKVNGKLRSSCSQDYPPRNFKDSVWGSEFVVRQRVIAHLRSHSMVIPCMASLSPMVSMG